MKWLLVMYVMTGDVHGLQTQEFKDKGTCEQVVLYINKQNAHFFKNWQANPFCVPL